MKKGDFVRFAKPEEIDHRFSNQWPSMPKPHLGILIDHDKLMGTAAVFYEGEVFKLRSVFVQKAGKKDFEKR
tara:strand:+ start:558 stop:773 length:216 start_codon:yes stop_codon:yes gene_type:complete